MSKDDIIKASGQVKEVLPNALFKVLLIQDDEVLDTEILCHISGKMRQNKIKILKGDIVEMEISIYDPTKGRITFRRKK